ncbi:Hypothetical predicted protein [Olea europaea subsp. europaea]|uniref:Uncharacterized protein n=1 Tax=Olea europaea subsp. europaea TaxID=158383 RepID=A0A8S0UVH4_OLEEU|nr:Hypothetical predicted protein [Olea europaea subsp. europaea]
MNPFTKGVIINVYIESSQIPSPNRKNGSIKMINPNPFCSKTAGYDRRRQLLEYAQELRHGNDPLAQGPQKNSRPKHKKWRWSLPMQRIKLLFSGFPRRTRQWKYERISTEKYSDAEGSSNQERRKTKAKGRKSDSHFCKKLKIFLKEISHSWQCNRGNC